ncbi:uncharacterized protein LOC112594285 [Melanaphis sacchari]|uniref:uncharacterized protein LOC112594285 n=1 Tax=Melanaphis sacchari TaxID=742174 RepID=UPI000DC14EBE|nr:uncharacterized protein LOC112594285 [Melanaphis sacchari]
MIPYKVLIILTFTINISHCEYSEEEIKKECKICAATLSLVGFQYKLPLINYNFAMQYTVSKDKSFTFESQLSNQLTEENINKLEQDYEKSLLSDKRKDFINAYYNEIIHFEHKLTPISPRDFCIEFCE